MTRPRCAASRLPPGRGSGSAVASPCRRTCPRSVVARGGRGRAVPIPGGRSPRPSARRHAQPSWLLSERPRRRPRRPGSCSPRLAAPCRPGARPVFRAASGGWSPRRRTPAARPAPPRPRRGPLDGPLRRPLLPCQLQGPVLWWLVTQLLSQLHPNGDLPLPFQRARAPPPACPAPLPPAGAAVAAVAAVAAAGLAAAAESAAEWPCVAAAAAVVAVAPVAPVAVVAAGEWTCAASDGPACAASCVAAPPVAAGAAPGAVITQLLSQLHLRGSLSR